MRFFYLIFLLIALPAQAQIFVVPESMITEPSASKADLGDLVDYLSSLTSEEQSPLYRNSAYWADVQDVSRTTDIDYRTIDCPAFRCFVVSAEQWSDDRPLRMVYFDWLVTVNEQREVVDARLIEHLNFSSMGDGKPLGNNSFVFQMDFPEKFKRRGSLCVYYRHEYNSTFDKSLLIEEEKDWFSYLVIIDASGKLYQHRVSSYRMCDSYDHYYAGSDSFITVIRNPRHARDQLSNDASYSSPEYLEGLLLLEPVSLSNVVHYNNIGFYLSEAGYHEGAIYVLNEVLQHFPNRTVAYINLGDAYWGLEKHTEARQAYQTYIRLMRESNREQRIPQRVFDRMGD
ncbi:MAG: tetratricopeptide repeat protein [Natronospirillum sp.]